MSEAANELLAEQCAVLERVARAAPLNETLDAIVHLVERRSTMPCAILLLDEATQRLRIGAAPSVPAELHPRLAAFKAGPEISAFESVDSPLAFPPPLRACWSTPIRSPQGPVLGAFVMSGPEARPPRADELAWVAAATHLAALALDRDRQERALRVSEERARQLAHIHALSSSVNEALVRARDRQEVFDLACRIAVEKGVAQLAWVGVYREDTDHLEPQSRFGHDDGYVDAIVLRLKDDRQNQGPAGRAVRTGAPSISNDIAADPDFFFKAEALRRGIRSCAVFPLQLGADGHGVFAIYGREPGFFREEELRVLTALAEQLSFAAESKSHELERRRLFTALGERTGQLERTHRLYNVLSKVNYAVVRSGSPAELLEATCRALAVFGGFPMAWMGELDPATREVRIVAREGDGAGYLDAVRVFADDSPAGAGPTGTALRDGQTRVCNDFLADPHTATWREAAADSGWRASAAIPIRRGGAFAFVMSVYAREPGFFGAPELALLEEVATEVSFALDNFVRELRRRHAEDALRDSERELRALAARIETIRENERAQLAREIHDVLGQDLTGLKMDGAWILRRLAEGSEESLVQATERLQAMLRQTDALIVTVRRIATSLRPGVLDDLGLAEALEWQAKEFQARAGIPVELDLEHGGRAVDPERSTAIFRIFQELLTNVARHAQARHVHAALSQADGALVLEVRDDGRGIIEGERIGSSSLGLLGMRERARAFGGDLVISGTPGEGTRAFVRLPLPPTEVTP